MFVDETHLFIPKGEKTFASGVLINEWMRQGRQPGLSLVLATQRPSALYSDVMSQCDILICHRLTSQDDIDALSSLRPIYMKERVNDSLKKMGDDRGVALLIDDTSESIHIIKVRPRKSWHGGDDPLMKMES